MQLDFRSVIVACGLVMLCVTLLMCAYAFGVKPRRKELVVGALSYVILSAGAALVSLRHFIPDALSILLSNLLLIGFFLGIRIAIFLFLGRPPRWGLVAAALALSAVWISLFAFAFPSYPLRFFFYNAMVFLIASLSARDMLRFRRPGLEAVSRIGAGILLAISLAMVGRVALALSFGLTDDLMRNAGWDSVLQALQAAMAATLSLLLMLLRTEGLNVELAQALRERELLVREMAHRTKNDLALVDSLLSLEQNAADAAAANGADRLDALRERIRCVAQAHERLSMSKDVGAIRLDEYLGAVADGLPGRIGVEVERDFAEVEIPFSSAAPLGLAMNELAVNALKYAFPDGRRGRIRLSLRAAEEGGEGRLRLEVSDDGVGAAWPPEKPGLGSMIVEAFAKQLSGSLEYRFDGGSRFVLSFPAARLEPRDRT